MYTKLLLKVLALQSIHVCIFQIEIMIFAPLTRLWEILDGIKQVNDALKDIKGCVVGEGTVLSPACKI